MCTVYRALELNMERVVALKVLRRHLTGNPDAIKRFQREAIAIAALEHPLIVKVFGFGSWQSRPYIVLEYLEGISLAQLLATVQELPRPRAMHIFEQICEALMHAHTHGVVHRDLKPSNVMLVDAADQIKLVDFGIAKILPDSTTEMQALTRSGDLVGSVSYMSPEQLSAGPVDQRSDIYSLGCLMYETLVGQPPFLGETSFEVAAAHFNDSPRPHPQLGDLQGIILSCLAKSPSDRPQSASDLKILLGNPAIVRSSRPSPPGRRLSRRQAIFSFAIICAVSAVVLATLVKRVEDQTREIRQLDSGTAVDAEHRAGYPRFLSNKQKAGHSIAKSEWSRAISPLLALVLDADTYSPREKNSLELQLAYCYLKVNKFTEARAALQDLDRRPMSQFERLTWCALMGDLHTQTKQFKEALPFRLQALQLASDKNSQIEPGVRASTILQAAVAYKFCGQYEQALPLFEKSLSISAGKQTPVLLDVYANTLVESGTTHLKIACKHFDRGLPDTQRYYEEGIKQLKEAASLPAPPNSPAALYGETAHVTLQRALKPNWYRAPQFRSPLP